MSPEPEVDGVPGGNTRGSGKSELVEGGAPLGARITVRMTSAVAGGFLPHAVLRARNETSRGFRLSRW